MNIDLITEAIKAWLANSFNPQEVFSSLTEFLGSGYVGVVVVTLFAYGLMKKLFKLFFGACLCLVVYFVITSHNYITILDQLRALMS